MNSVVHIKVIGILTQREYPEKKISTENLLRVLIAASADIPEQKVGNLINLKSLKVEKVF